MQVRVRVSCLIEMFLLCLLCAPTHAQVTVTAASPSAVTPGITNVQVTISGTHFKRGAKASFVLSGTNNPGDVTVSGTGFVSSSDVAATISVSSTASNNTYDIIVTNTDGSSGKGTELFAVNKSTLSTGGIAATSTVYDTDLSANALLLASDDNPSPGQASYTSIDGISSAVASNEVYLDLRSQTVRTVRISFSSPVAGSPPSPIPDGYYAARVLSRCYDANNNIFSLFGIANGSTNNRCSLRVGIPIGRVTYVFVMAPIYAGTGYANVTCTGANSSGCTSWHIEPNMDSADFPGNVPTVANLYTESHNGALTLIGSYHNTYRIDFHE